MANSERKRRTKRLAALGWSWEPSWNAYVFFNRWATPALFIEYDHKKKAWGVRLSSAPGIVTFDCPLVAATWAEIEHADDITEIRESEKKFRAYCLADAAAPRG